MGITNIHVFYEPETNHMARKAQAMLEEKLIVAHRRGEHPYGMKRRECPLCRAGK